MQCAIQIYKSFDKIKNSASLSAMMYSNLSTMHLNMSFKSRTENEDRSCSYIDGAIISSKKFDQMQE